MNPVDHVSSNPSGESPTSVLTGIFLSRMVVVTINILAKPLQSQDTQHKDRKPASLRLGGLVCFVVLKRQRIRYFLYMVIELLGVDISNMAKLWRSTSISVEVCGHSNATAFLITRSARAVHVGDFKGKETRKSLSSSLPMK